MKKKEMKMIKTFYDEKQQRNVKKKNMVAKYSSIYSEFTPLTRDVTCPKL